MRSCQDIKIVTPVSVPQGLQEQQAQLEVLSIRERKKRIQIHLVIIVGSHFNNLCTMALRMIPQGAHLIYLVNTKKLNLISIFVLR